MALQCINKKLPEYQRLKKISDIPEILLDATCVEYLEKFNRFPRFDELPFSNSENTIKEELQIDRNNGVSIKKILEYTKTDNIDDAVIALNNQFLDLEIEIDPVLDKGIISVKKRPTEEYKNVEDKNIDISNNKLAITKALEKLSKLYGININTITDSDLDQFSIPRDKLTKAFVYNGEIYLNADRFSRDSFIHEMMHLLVGSMRFSNPEVYQNLIDSVENFDLYPQLLREFENKSRNDAKEEIFITQLAKYLAGMDSVINSLTEEQLYEINYNVRRILDSMLMGDFSSKVIDDLYHQKFSDVVKFTNSDILSTTYSYKNSIIHRQLNNIKSDLLKKSELIETCD